MSGRATCLVARERGSLSWEGLHCVRTAPRARYGVVEKVTYALKELSSAVKPNKPHESNKISYGVNYKFTCAT